MAPLSRGSRPRHVPQRTCIACRQTDAKRQLVRVVRTPDGHVSLDPTGKRSGRGAYVHESAACWHTVLTRALLPRALKLSSAIPEDDLQTLHAYAERLSGTSEPVASPPRQPSS